MSKHQAFTIKTISRALLKNAPYNPRIISDDAKKRLKKRIKKSGLVEPFIWNETTGNLVGGHQRLAILDELEGRIDYAVTVSALRIREDEEMKLNVFLNNRSAMGDFDQEKLGKLIEELKDFESLGFGADDMEVIFDDATFGGLFSDEKESAKAEGEQIKEMKELRKEHRENSDETEGGDHYSVLVFRTRRNRDAFLKWLGLPEGERFVDGRVMTSKVEALIRNVG